MKPQDLQAQGDHDLAERLLGEREIQRAIEFIEKKDPGRGARHHLLATATRLTPQMAPDLHALIDRCRTTLGVEGPLEMFVYPDQTFNAAAVRREEGRLLLMLSAGLLEAFEPEELSFVAGHEVGHWLFDHHRIPVAPLLRGKRPVSAALALELFAWQRYAEISADRAGLVCAGDIAAAASALFKLASGLSGGRVRVDVEQFMAQVGDLRAETERLAGADEAPRGDWFSTHPFSPLRLKAVELCARSTILRDDGIPRDQLEAEVHELMTLMAPSYLQARTDIAEMMRRLLFAGGVAIAAASGSVTAEAIEALEKLLGPGSIPPEVKPDVIMADLPDRITAVREGVPSLRRAQIIRDLCVIARADGHVDHDEIAIIRDIAEKVGVDESLIACTVDQDQPQCVSSSA